MHYKLLFAKVLKLIFWPKPPRICFQFFTDKHFIIIESKIGLKKGSFTGKTCSDVKNGYGGSGL